MLVLCKQFLPNVCKYAASPASLVGTVTRQQALPNIPYVFGGSFTAAGSSVAAVVAKPTAAGIWGLLDNYKQLSKAKLSAFVVMTCAAGFVAGSEGATDWEALGYTTLGTFGAAACANTLNQIYEVSNDALMKRTRNRPLPSGRLTLRHARVFALATGIGGVGLLALKTNFLTSALGATNIALYAGVYTPLKQLSIYNTWVGAVVGAIPPVMGWAAATGSIEPAAVVLAAALFSWQMPHFLSLAWICKNDYIQGGFKMLSMADPSGSRTAAVSVRHSLLLIPVGLAATLMHMASPSLAVEAAVLAGGMVHSSMLFRQSPSNTNARRMFRYSLAYIPLLVLGIFIHKRPNDHYCNWQAAEVHARQAGSTAIATMVDLPRSLADQAVASWAGLIAFTERISCPARVYGEEKPAEEVEQNGS